MRTFRIWSFKVGTMFMRWAGDEGSAEWNRMKRDAQDALDRYVSADLERWVWIKKFHALRDAAKLTDGLMSGGNPTEAQQQLRLALIASGETFGRRS